jgi:hypothetical protein
MVVAEDINNNNPLTKKRQRRKNKNDPVGRIF